DALGNRFHGCGFTCEPTGNLVHCETIEPAGATFVGHPQREGVEFLASPDTWFRPVNLETGPDGALYVVDMYRAVIEHPQFVPDELKNRPDLRYGDDRGRIYRLVAEGQRSPTEPPHLAHAGPDKVAPLLAHENPWYRSTAARLLYVHQWRQAKPVVERILSEAKQPAARVQALWTLHGWRDLSPELLERALGDPHPRVREAAVLLAEPLLADRAELRKCVMELSGDRDARLRFQVALSLGAAPGEEVLQPLANIALAGADDVWTRRAVLTAVPDLPHKFLARLLDQLPGVGDSAGHTQAGRARYGQGIMELLAETARLVGARRQTEEVAGVLNKLASVIQLSHKLAIVTGMARGMQSRGLSWTTLVARFDQDAAARAAADGIFRQAAELAQDSDSELAQREQACALLQFGSDELAVPVLAGIIDRETNQTFKQQAVASLAAHASPRATNLLIAQLNLQTPAI
ncbi:MAG TPA: HEAT repeat domain-containing protein, partial [Pirellulales bacterium]|nr:HEAT repeat domain-containing protein [Pirellulales bacterium]